MKVYKKDEKRFLSTFKSANCQGRQCGKNVGGHFQQDSEEGKNTQGGVFSAGK